MQKGFAIIFSVPPFVFADYTEKSKDSTGLNLERTRKAINEAPK